MTSENSELPDIPATTDSSAPRPPAARERKPSRALLAIFAIAVVVLALDQLSKMWAQASLVEGEAARPLLGELVQLRLIYNSGAALSIGSGTTWLLTALSAGVVVFIFVTARRIRSTAWAVALGLVLGGALGNLLDRFFREPGFPNGHVVDFIDYGPFIGNVADIAIVGAAVLIAFLALRGIGPDGVRITDAEPSPEGEDSGAEADRVEAGAADVADADETDHARSADENDQNDENDENTAPDDASSTPGSTTTKSSDS